MCQESCKSQTFSHARRIEAYGVRARFESDLLQQFFRRFGVSCERADDVQVFGAGEVLVERRLMREERDFSLTSERCRSGSSPKSLNVPRLQGRAVAGIQTVVLPLPLPPTIKKRSPCEMSRSTRARAHRWPNRRESASVSMTEPCMGKELTGDRTTLPSDLEEEVALFGVDFF